MAAVRIYVSINMIILILVFGSALSAPTDEFGILVNDGELTLNDDKYVMHIVPGMGYSPQKLQSTTNYKQKVQLSDIVDKENNNYKLFMMYVEKGYTNKGLTFNIYDDNMREAAIALFQLLRDIKNDEDFDKIKEWAKHNLNIDMFEYAWRLVSLYDGKFGEKEKEPLFRFKPNHFVNSETIMKALKLMLKDGHFSNQEAEINQFFVVTDRENTIAINTNYSNWNSINGEWNDKIDYFTEDISLNSYYYGVQLLHPFWMSNDELDEINSRHAEQYYFIHQQLMARYLLEKERFKHSNVSVRHNLEIDYNPQLTYDNGLPFPVQPTLKKDSEWSDNLARVSSIYTAIKECISRGIIFMDNGTIIKMTEDNYVDLITKLIRANFDGVKTAKLIRSVYGYGPNGYPLDKYNPAPSLLHHPETSLRDPTYWYMIKYMLDHFTEYRNMLKPYDLSKDETEEYCILNFDYHKITTYFNYYQFQINNAIDRYYSNYMPSPLELTARQKRLTHFPFSLDFTVESIMDKNVVIRLFLGPKCLTDDECWRNYSKFYQLDVYTFNLKSGTNDISWSPNKSKKLSFDESFNVENNFPKQSNYNIYNFPENLLIPKGLEHGLNLTLFIIITPAEDSNINYDYNPSSSIYNRVSLEQDSKPLGFPFHRPTTGYSHSACNYKYFNITVFHKRWPLDGSGYFSPHLY